MSNTYKDKPWELGGKRRKYWTSEKYHAWFTRQCRRTARAKAKAEMRRGKEPARVYPIERAYYD